MHASTHTRRRGFTLVEALVAITLMGLAGSALLLGIQSALITSEAVVEQMVAVGLAEQLLDEMAAVGFSDDPTPLGAGGSREAFDDLGDYDGLADQPPRDRWGIPLGQDDGVGGVRDSVMQASSGFMARWRREVSVQYVASADLTTALGGGQTSAYRLVEVRVYCDHQSGSRQVLALRRVFVDVAVVD